jgi:hypothetical protein
MTAPEFVKIREGWEDQTPLGNGFYKKIKKKGTDHFSDKFR